MRRRVCFSLMVYLFSISMVPLGICAWKGPYLEFTNLSSNEIVLHLPLRIDETFTIRYIHSVDQSPVFEVFELDQEGALALQATYFKMFGAGMGHWQGRGVVDFDGEWTWIRDIHETLGSFILRVGSPSVDHTLLYRGQEIPLSRKWAGKRLHVTVVRGSLGVDTRKNNHAGGQ